MSFETEHVKLDCWKAIAEEKSGDVRNQLLALTTSYHELLMLQEFQWEDKGHNSVGLELIRRQLERRINELLDDALQARRNART